MLITIDSQASDPIYTQIVREIRRAIVRGEVKAGERLPAARVLADSLDVNMHTVLRAYTELREAGEIDLRRGRGAVVLARERLDAEVAAALNRLLEVAKRKRVSLSELHQAIDERGN